MIPTWTIWLDGLAYSGETSQQERAVPTSGRGWTGKQPEQRNCIGARRASGGLSGGPVTSNKFMFHPHRMKGRPHGIRAVLLKYYQPGFPR